MLKGGKPGSDYVRIHAPVQTLRWGDGGVLTPAERESETSARRRPSREEPEPANGARAGNATRMTQQREGVVLPGLGQRVVLPGTRPGGSYVRRELPTSREFRQRGENVIEATERSLLPQSATGRAYERVKRVLIGNRLTTEQQVHERLTKVKALAVLSSDAISSVAYGTEASLGILIAAGLGVLHVNLIIGGVIALLMVIVGTSYWQTIHAYPQGGGSYIVARDNLGVWPGLIAAAALLIDYVLTVSVSVSAGVGALVSAVPAFSHYTVELGVLFILIIMVVNLRGIRESGTIFAAPTYLFIGAFLIMIVTGLIHAALSPGGLLTPVHPTTPVFLPQNQGGLGWTQPSPFSLFLVLTAFASGCSAMTGVEAISDGVPAFKAPESHNAAKTLVWMIATLVTLFLGITFLTWRFGVLPFASQNPTLDSQLARLLFGTGPMFFLIQFATLLILVLAANTSFADFPRLSFFLARDGFMPHQFSFRGDRLAFTTGITALSVLSIVLLVAFNGNTDALINLYALGVFTAFTLSQSGMVMRWYRKREAAGPNWRRLMIINGIGATATGIVALVIMVSKFDRGAWIVVLLVPLLALMFRGISRHYAAVRRQTEALTPLQPEELRHIMLVPVAELNRPALQSLAYARSLSPHVVALHVSLDEDEERTFRAAWEKFVEKREQTLAAVMDGTAPRTTEVTAKLPREKALALLEKQPQLVVIESPYRSLVPPLLAYVNALRDANPGATVSVVLPEFVPAHWWERLLHNQTALRLKLALYADPGVVVVNVPHLLRRQYGT